MQVERPFYFTHETGSLSRARRDKPLGAQSTVYCRCHPTTATPRSIPGTATRSSTTQLNGRLYACRPVKGALASRLGGGLPVCTLDGVAQVRREGSDVASVQHLSRRKLTIAPRGS